MSTIARVVVLGHSGLIGSPLLDHFREHSPDIEVVPRSLPEVDLTNPDQAHSLAELFDRDTGVIMLSGIKRQLGDSLGIFEANMKMVVNVASLLAERPVARFIYVSSAAVYGEEIDNTSISEDTPVCPQSHYGIAKYASERLLRKMAGEQDIELVCARPPLVYGPGDGSKSYGPAGFTKSIVAGEEIVLWGDGSELREFLFVGDLARILHDLVFAEYCGVVNAVCGRSHCFKDILDILGELTGGGLQVAQRERSKDQVDNAFIGDRLAEALPAMEFTPLADGIRMTFEAEQSSN